ncbi:LCP family protein [Aeromicrobium sp. Sec7.5]|uniref:LCP family protein n=1 Tax=Aeromicrobium sp. Sec7.5 TaxID=3121276 RepID=UPI002FE45CD7
MPQQPSDGYDWLYDGKPSTAPRRDAPAPPSQLPPPNLPPPGRRAPAPPAGGRPRSTRRWWIRIPLLLLVLWLVFLVATPFWALRTTSRVDVAPGGERPGDQPGTTYLVVGSDSRAGLTPEEQAQLATGGDEGGNGRTDTIMILHVGDGPALLLSVPRDSLVDVPGYGTTKINAAYSYGGPSLLTQTVEQSTGLRIDGYLEIGFGGLVKVVDAVGGVEICPAEAITDPDAGLDVAAGCQEADGATALGYARSRHSYATQDIQRVQAQREVMGSLAGEIKSPSSVLNPFRYVAINKGGAASLTIGEDVSTFDLVRFARGLSSAMSGDGLNCTVPLRDFSVRWDAERAGQMFELVATDRTSDIGDLCTADGLPASG